MNRTQQLGDRIAIVVASAAILAVVGHVSPEPAAASFIPSQTASSSAAICRTGDVGRPDPAWLKESFENDNCSLPQEPPVLDGTKASRAQLMAGLAAAKQFAASADQFQQCISVYLAQRKQQAERTGGPMKTSFVAIEAHRIVASEASKKRVRDQIAMAVDNFNAEGSECPQ